MTQTGSKFQRQHLAVIGLLSVIFILLSLFVHLTHAVYEGRTFYDHDWYFTENFHNTLNTPPIGPSKLIDWLHLSPPGGSYYSLVNLSLGLLALIKPVDLLTYRSINLIFLALMMIGAFLLGTQLADRRAGLLGAVAVAALPVIDESSRTFNPHFHAAAFMLLAFAVFVRLVQKPESRPAYPVFGVVCGLAVMTHPISLMQSSLLFGFLFLLMLFRDNKAGTALRLASALVCFLLLIHPFLRALPKYTSEKSLFLFEPASSMPLLTAMTKEWMMDISTGFFGPWFLIVFAIFAIVAINYLVATKDRRPDDLIIIFNLICYACLSLAIRLSNGFTKDLLLFACLAAVLSIALVWREMQRNAHLRKFIPLAILLLFTAAFLQKSAALDAYPSGDSTEYRSRLLPTRSRLILEPDWLRCTMNELDRYRPVRNVVTVVDLQTPTLEPGQSPELLTTQTRKIAQAAKQLHGWDDKIKPSGTVLLTLAIKDEPWTAPEAAAWLRGQLGDDPAAYADVFWLVKNGDQLTFGLDHSYLLELMRWTH